MNKSSARLTSAKNISSATVSGDLGILSMNVDSLTWLHGPKCFIFALHFRDANQPCAVSALRKWISDLTSSQSWRSWWCQLWCSLGKKNKTRYSLIGRVIFLRSWLDSCEISVQVLLLLLLSSKFLRVTFDLLVATWPEQSTEENLLLHKLEVNTIWVAMNVFVEGQWNDRSWWPNCPTLQEFAWSRGRVVPLVLSMENCDSFTQKASNSIHLWTWSWQRNLMRPQKWRREASARFAN